jgi:hypothetical protein
MKPGSEEELNRLVSTLRNLVIGKEQAFILQETIQFLAQVEEFHVAKELYEAYESFKKQIQSIQTKRLEEDSRKTIVEVENARRNGEHYERIILDCEKAVNEISCADFLCDLQTLFTYRIRS